MLARQKNYAEAQRIKKIADKLEEKERKAMEQHSAALFARKEAKFRQQQQAELQALLKRIDARGRNTSSSAILTPSVCCSATATCKRSSSRSKLSRATACSLRSRRTCTIRISKSPEWARPMEPTNRAHARRSQRRGKTTSSTARSKTEDMPTAPGGAPDMASLTDDDGMMPGGAD